MGAGNNDLRAAGAAANLDEVNLQALTLSQNLTAHLLGSGQNSLALLAAGNNIQISSAGARIDAGNHAVQDLVLLALELGDNHAALCLADALNDNLLCSLGSNAAEGLGRDVDINDIAYHRVVLVLGSLLKSDLLVRLVQILRLDNRLADKHVNGLLVAVRLNVNIIGHAVVIALVGGDQRLTYTVEHIVYRNAFFLFQLFQRVKKFCVNHFFLFSSFLYLYRQSNCGNVFGFVYGLLAVHFQRYGTVVIAGECALDLLHAVHRLVKAYFDGLTHKRLEMLRTLEAARHTCRGNAQRIGRHIVKFLFIQHGIKRARNLLALVNVDALRSIHGDGQHVLSALFFKLHIPQGNTSLFTQRLYQFLYAGYDLLCLQSRPSLLKNFLRAKRKEWHLATPYGYLSSYIGSISRIAVHCKRFCNKNIRFYRENAQI